MKKISLVAFCLISFTLTASAATLSDALKITFQNNLELQAERKNLEVQKEVLNISKSDMTLLQPNVTFHMIAVMQFGNWGVEASEAIRVTDKGSELFCNFSRELHVKS